MATPEWRFALRRLRRSPGFTSVAVLILGLGIGACTTIYSVVHAVVIQPLPYEAPEQLLRLWQINQGGSRSNFSDPNFEDVEAQSSHFQAIAQYRLGTRPVVAGTTAVRAGTSSVSVEFFDVFRTRPVRGRTFAAAEQRFGAAPTAIVSHRFWQRHFAGVDDLAAAPLRIEDKPHTVVGVLPPTFEFPPGTEIYVPRELQARNPYRTGHNWPVVARLRDDVRLESARTAASQLAARLHAELDDETWMRDVALVPLREQLVGDARPTLVMLLGAAGLLLVVACSNLTNLLIVRIAQRRRELAVRSALGADTRSVLMPVLAESVLLAAGGGAIGVVLSIVGVRTLVAMAPAELPRSSEIAVGWPALLFALAAVMVTAVSLAIVSGWRARRLHAADGLKDAHRGEAGSATAGRFRRVLVVGQLVVSVVLLVAAGLLGRSLWRLLDQDPGFRTRGILAIDLAHPSPDVQIRDGRVELADPSSPRRRAQLHEALLDRLSGLPGVTAAGGIAGFPLGSGYGNGRFVIVQGQDAMTLDDLAELANDPERTGDAHFRVASADYFRALDIPLVRGRLFEQVDQPDAPHVAVISESLARTRWPDEDPIGLRIQFGGMDGDMRIFTIVGIVGDIRETGLDAEPRPTFYVDYRQRPRATVAFTVVLQTAVPPASLVSPARAILSELAPTVPPRFRTIEEIVAASVADRRFNLWVVGVFGSAALLLAVLGVYGVLSSLVAQRRAEFGVRMALGASSLDIRRLVFRDAAWLVLAGLAVGAVAALLTTRTLAHLLYGVTPSDPVTYAIVMCVLVAASGVASQLPAMRAARVDPLTALRDY